VLAHWQAKWYEDFYSHTGQLCAGMRVTREQYCRAVLGKRKRDDVDPLLTKVRYTVTSTLGRIMTQLIPACNRRKTEVVFFQTGNSIDTDNTAHC
jgi:hypothetical protein